MVTTSTREFAVHRRGAARPRVVLLDLDHWDSFASFAPAVRRRGMAVARIARPTGGLAGALGRVVDRLVFGRPGAWLAPGTTLASAVQGLLGAPSVDVQGAEDVVEPLREQLPWSSNPVAARVPDPDHVTMLFDKLAMTRFAESVPVAVPRTWETPPLDVLPLVVKGRLGAGGQAVRIARSHEEVADAVVELEAAGHGRLFFQELAEGTLTNVGGVADRGRLLVAGAYRAVAPEHDPLGPPESIEVVSCPGIEADLPPLLGALEYSGFFCIDYIERPDGSAALIDFNPRIFAGWLALQSAGVDLLGAYLSLHGLAPTPVPAPAPLGATVDVRLLPESGASSWGQLATRVRRSGRQLRRVAPVTGAGFLVAMGVRVLRTGVGDAVGLALGGRS